MTLTILKVVAVVLVALCLVPTGAHLLEMPGKMALDKAGYFTVQRIYGGWALFGIAEVAAIVAAAALAWAERGWPLPMWLAAAGAALIALSLGVFFALTYPANVATDNWTKATDDWEALRRSWESGHALEAVLTFLAFLAVATAVALDD